MHIKVSNLGKTMFPFKKSKEKTMTVDINTLQNTLRNAVSPPLQELLNDSYRMQVALNELLQRPLFRSADDILPKISMRFDEVVHLLATVPVEIRRLHKRFDRIEALLMNLPAIAEAKTKKELKDKEKLLDTKIEDLGLSARARNALKREYTAFQAGHDYAYCLGTIRDLIKLTGHQLLLISNFGPKSLKEIKEVLATMGLKLKEQD
jgi:ABC-type transporter Mla subunit MlaD